MYLIGWSDLNVDGQEKGNQFLTDDAMCRDVLKTVMTGQFRRGGQLFSDCFTAAEVVDCLLDHDIVHTLKEAVVMGQELVFVRKLLPVYIETEYLKPETSVGNLVSF